MSYKKIAAVVDPASPAQISFYYTVDSVFNESSLRSMYQTKVVRTEAGAPLVDELSFTEDERDFHKKLMADATSTIFNMFLKYTKGIENAIGSNEEYIVDPETPLVTTKASWVNILDNAAYNENYIKAIDIALLKCIQFNILSEWFSTVAREADAQKFAIKFNTAWKEVYNGAFQLKKLAL